jgi:DNA primase large subunit
MPVNANTTPTFEDAYRQSDCTLPAETLAVHPWISEVSQIASIVGLDAALDDEAVIDRAVERILTGVNNGTIAKPRGTSLTTEFLSYPVARIIVSIIDDRRLTSRYVVAEADHSIGVLDPLLWHPSEPFDALALFDEFGIETEQMTAYELLNEERRACATPEAWNQTLFRIPFEQYLSVGTRINEDGWRLVHRDVNDGYVAIEKDEVVTFLRAGIEKRIGDPLPRDVPDEIAERVNEAVEIVSSNLGEGAFTKEIDRVEEGLYPPVIKQMLEDFPHNLSHMQKVTLAAFLLHIGMNEDEVVESLGVLGTPGEDPTRKQVHHIANNSGDGEPYMPANYDTIQTHGYEWEMDALETKVKNPLSYYRIKLDDAEDDAFVWLDVYGKNVSPMLTYPAGPVSLKMDENALPDGFTVTNNGATWTCNAVGDQHATGLALVAVVEGFTDPEGLSMKFLKEMDSTDAVNLCVLARAEYEFTGQPPTYVLEAIATAYGFECVKGKSYLSKTGKKDAREAFDVLIERATGGCDVQ